MNNKLFKAALERAEKTWKTYITVICVLNLTLLIDWLSGSPFLHGNEPIKIAGFEVVRQALSATYGILFFLFVATAFLESRLLKTSAASVDSATLNELSVLDLWLLSPLSDLRFLRTMFWLLFIDGFVLLAVFSVAHLALINPPDPARMSPKLYMLIGAVDFVVYAICVLFADRLYRNFEYVRRKINETKQKQSE